MRVAVIGSRSLRVPNLGKYLPPNTTAIISGGARGIDTDAKTYALGQYIPYREFLPEYQKYHRGAPLKRNLEIIAAADLVLAFWDGHSRGTRYVVEECEKQGIPFRIILLKNTEA